jgi:hypothetical protein
VPDSQLAGHRLGELTGQLAAPPINQAEIGCQPPEDCHPFLIWTGGGCSQSIKNGSHGALWMVAKPAKPDLVLE